jgi:hypothetical protein
MPDGERHHGLCINLKKERISKSPLIHRTQDNINNYNCFCKLKKIAILIALAIMKVIQK